MLEARGSHSQVLSEFRLPRSAVGGYDRRNQGPGARPGGRLPARLGFTRVKRRHALSLREAGDFTLCFALAVVAARASPQA